MHFTISLVGAGVDPWGKPMTYALALPNLPNLKAIWHVKMHIYQTE